jgi:hypothetical protein
MVSALVYAGLPLAHNTQLLVEISIFKSSARLSARASLLFVLIQLLLHVMISVKTILDFYHSSVVLCGVILSNVQTVDALDKQS